MYFLYTVDETADEPIMLINKHIGFDSEEGMGIMGDQFERELLVLDGMGKKRIKVFINSPGGVVADAMSICNAILKSKTKVDTYCTGVAASCAANIFLTGRKRVMADYGILMVHDPVTSTGETATENEIVAAFRKSIVTLLSSRSGKAEAEISAMMAKETWLTPSQALESGMCDLIEVSSEFNKKRLQPNQDVMATWKEATLIMNKIHGIQNKNTMSEKITSILNLHKEASPEAIEAAIMGIKNELTQKDAAILDVQNKLTDTMGELETVKNQAAEATSKLKEFEDAAKAAENEALTVKCEAMVNEFAAKGHIKAEVVNKWVERAKVDFEGIKAELEAMPVNKVAPTPEDKVTAGAVPYTMAARMAEINNRAKGK
jgi:ATP-dependent Clp endopeptidase proteolytic subunit ClpP